MPRYFYTAQSLEGESKSGVLEAKDAHQLARVLRQEGLILIRAELEKRAAKKKFELSFPSFGVSLPEKLFFTRNLRIMIAAGISLPRALEILATQTKNKKFKNTLFEISEKVVRGESFSKGLSQYPEIFSELFQGMIKVGEESGTLKDVLGILAQQIEREYDLKSKIKGAMIYPAIIICLMIIIGILMLIFVIPRLAETFKELGVELPLTTKIVIGLGEFLVQKWYLAILIPIFLIFLFWRITKTKIGKKIIDALILKIPLISSIVQKANSASTTRSLSSLISAGVPIVRALEITSGTLGNIHYQLAIKEVAEKVRKGERIAAALESYQNIYPSIVIQMVAIGEETGETSKILAQLADFFEEEVSNIVKNLGSIIEPILMIVIGGAVGFFAIAMLQPIYSMLQALQ